MAVEPTLGEMALGNLVSCPLPQPMIAMLLLHWKSVKRPVFGIRCGSSVYRCG